MPSEERIHHSIDRAYKKAKRVNFDINIDKWILFSDHHRGSGDEADDFKQCKSTYEAALKHYYDLDYGLGLLGDVEELWENKIQAPLKLYEDTIKLEELFNQSTRFFRIWGNHDDFWREKIVFRHFFKDSYQNIQCHESVVIDCFRDGAFLGEIVLIHGHQGSWFSEKLVTISRFFVRYGWRNFQRITGVKLTSASKDLKLKSKTDHAMYSWSEKNQKVLICGHTHQPVFMSGTHLDHLIHELHIESYDEKKKDLEMQLVKLQKNRTHIHAPGERIPLYFNTGCCSYADGDITGIELSSKGLSLVKWSKSTYQKSVLNKVVLEHLFDKPHIHKNKREGTEEDDSCD